MCKIRGFWIFRQRDELAELPVVRPALEFGLAQAFKLGNLGQHRFNILALLFKSGTPARHDAQTFEQLRRFILGRVIHPDQILDLGQRQAEPLAAQGHFQARPVTAGEHALAAFALRREDALIFPEANSARRDAEFAGQVRNGKGAGG